jgi:hypothetical protein
MNKKILNEINEMKYLFGYKRGVVISEQVSELEQRAQNAYKLMIGGASGPGTNPKKIRAGMDILTTADEFYRMNSLFKDKKTGYKSFDEMIRGELESGVPWPVFLGSNVGTHKYIKSKLNSLSVSYEYLIHEWDKFYLKNVITIDQPLVAQAPVTPPAAPAAKTAAAVVDNWEDVKKYYKDSQDVDPQPAEDDTKTWETLTVTENGRTYILRSDNNDFQGKDIKYARGSWSWDGTKPVFSLKKTARKETTGYVNDSDTSWDVVTDKKKVIGLGASGPLVKKLQTALIVGGYADGLTITDDMEGCKEDSEKCDGIYGKGTRDAVKKAQEDLELDVDGVVGSETYEAMPNL